MVGSAFEQERRGKIEGLVRWAHSKGLKHGDSGLEDLMRQSAMISFIGNRPLTIKQYVQEALRILEAEKRTGKRIVAD